MPDSVAAHVMVHQRGHRNDDDSDEEPLGAEFEDALTELEAQATTAAELVTLTGARTPAEEQAEADEQ